MFREGGSASILARFTLVPWGKRWCPVQIWHLEILNGHSCGRCLALHFEQKMVLVADSSLFFFVWVGLLKGGFFWGDTEAFQYYFSGEIFLPLSMILLDPIGEVDPTSDVSICEIIELSRSAFTWTGSTKSTKFGYPTREEVVLGYLEVFNNRSQKKIQEWDPQIFLSKYCPWLPW